jgi:DNA-binding XRE family transcriptional regulator
VRLIRKTVFAFSTSSRRTCIKAPAAFTVIEGVVITTPKEGEMITSEQMKAARALLGWSDVKLAREAGLAPSTIINFELGTRNPPIVSMLAIESTLKAAGVEFPRHGEARLRKRGP